MELLVNELSINGQFPDIAAFRLAIGRVMTMRARAKQFDRDLYCHKNLVHAQVTRDLTMPRAIQRLDREEKTALLQWFTRQGPFWDEDEQAHGPDDYLEYEGEVVTDTGVGEAAFRCLHGNEYHLISLTPSAWEHSSLLVRWLRGGINDREVAVVNHTTLAGLEVALRSEPAPIKSWERLAAVARARFSNLTFSATAFDPLRGQPLVPGAVPRIMTLLEVLDRLRGCVDQEGKRTPEGQNLYQEHFTGDKAWFSDSSDSEKREFRSELTFKNPEREGETLFCPFHGKIKIRQYRIHFSWPVPANESLHIVHVGPKITQR